MYVPRSFAMDPGLDDAALRAFVEQAAVGQLVTVGPDGAPDASLLPVVWQGDVVVMHLARINPQVARLVDGAPGLVVVSGPDAYVSPGWYASKREHGKVVPTWNYSAVHLRGILRVHEDAGWLRDAVTLLTEHHESFRPEPWSVQDPPAAFVDGQLRAIVGVSLTVTEAVGKAKLSQNRPVADQVGALAGLRAEAAATTGHGRNVHADEVADAMEALPPRR